MKMIHCLMLFSMLAIVGILNHGSADTNWIGEVSYSEKRVGMENPQLEELYKYYAEFLENYVEDGDVKYEAIPESEVNELLSRFANIDLKALQPPRLKALYINAYNFFAIAGIVKNYPVDSPMDVEGFFSQDCYNLGKKSVTLDKLEKKMLYQEFPDARLHLALVCAAKGCPALLFEPYRDGRLDTQLDKVTRYAMQNDEYIRVDYNTVRLPKIFEWYAKDFRKEAKSPVAWINKYRTSKIPQPHTVSYYEYDWKLNEVR